MDRNLQDLLKGHSKRYIEMALDQNRRIRLAAPDGCGKRTGDCGDTMEFFLQIRDGRIFKATFDMAGCLNTAVCANAVSFLTEGKTIEEAWDIAAEDIIDYLETLLFGHHHCAELAVGTFYLALSNYAAMIRAPWKKMYRLS